MTTYAWVIDQSTCIGCHACTTACKAENEVPLGVNRTWVKYVERGTYPETRRDIAVLRCNHCAEPPCVEVCPTTAMYKRADGIVDFDTDRCIGCKACIQACPYDAIYIDPDEHVAEKCNFCSHRVDQGLLPACVVVCPTESLVFGDIEDPSSRAARVIASRQTTVRRPEQGTRPQAYYVGASPAALDPLAAVHGDRYVWADRLTGGSKDHTARLPVDASPGEGSGAGPVGGSFVPRSSLRGTMLPVLSGGTPPLGAVRGPGVHVPSRVLEGPPLTPEALAAVAAPATAASPAAVARARPGTRVAYDVFHPRPWGWKVATYLWTKGIGAGAFAVVFLAAALGLAPVDTATRLAAGFVALLGVGLTALLLVADLKRPERFLSILYRPQRRSWLVIGAYILVGYSGLLGAWWLGTLLGAPDAALTALGWVTLAFAVATALYTMFLLAQCEARDLWQRPATGVVLIAQAAILGGATLLGVLAAIGGPDGLVVFAAGTMAGGGAANLGALVLGEVVAGHPTANGRAAAHLLVRGPFATSFWGGGIVFGGVAPVAAAVLGLGLSIAALPAIPVLVAGGLVAALGLLWYELGFIAAGQAVPIS